MTEEADVQKHNQRTLWADVANHLTIAAEAVEQAQAALEDLGLSINADALDEYRERLEGLARDAREAGV